MLIDPTVQQIGIGGVVAVALVATVMKFLPAFLTALKAQNGNGKNSSGQQSPSYWTLEMGRIVAEKLRDHESKLREIVRDELESWGRK